MRVSLLAAAWLAAAAAAPAQTADPPPTVNAKSIFAAKCSWCHAAYGLRADKGPRLAGTTMTDAQLADRIRNGLEGSMPGFGKSLNDAQVEALIQHIRSLPAQP